jgi:pilus assembly protein CpaB
MANLTRTLAILFLTLAVALGVFAFMLARTPERAANPTVPAQSLAANQRLTPVVVAARDVPAGQSLDAGMLSVRMQAEPASGGFNQIDALDGRVTRIAVAQGTPLTQNALSSGLADVIQPGERAVAVRIDDSNAVGNYVRPGNYVDVFFTLKRVGGATADAEIQATQARLLLSKVRVLGVGSASLGGPDASAAHDANAAANSTANRLSARTAVLAVRTADVDALTLAESEGRLTLALRNTEDDETTPPPSFAPLVQTQAAPSADGAARAAAGVSLSALAAARVARESAAARATAPAKVTARGAPRGEEIEVIRGGRVERTVD